MALRENQISESAVGNPESWSVRENSIGSPEEDQFSRILQFLKKRWWIVAATTVLGLIVGLFVNRLSQKLFTAVANIEIESQDISSQFRIEQMQGVSATEDTSERLDSEIEILRSRQLALETIKELHLDNNRDFVPPPDGKPWDLSKPAVRQMLSGNFRSSINVVRLGHTDIVQIYATSRNPELASMIVNTLIDRYIEHSFRENYAATSKISTWLDEKLNGLRSNLEKSQAHILELQKDIGVFGINESHSIVTANLEELNKQYADAEVRNSSPNRIIGSRSKIPSREPGSVGLP